MFDSHAHLDYEPFYDDLPAVAEKMAAAGVRWAVNPAVSLESARRAAKVAGRYGWVLPALGVHPLYLAGADAGEGIGELEVLASGHRFYAVGETGLDFWEGREGEALQREWFEAQITLAKKLRLPLLIHCRKAFYEVAAMLKQANYTGGGVFHAFSGSWQMAAKALDLGFHLSACANITRPTKAALLEVLRRVPRDRLLVETDAPDMPPHEKRGQTHYPWDLPITVAALGKALGITMEEAGEMTERNALTLFGVRG